MVYRIFKILGCLSQKSRRLNPQYHLGSQQYALFIRASRPDAERPIHQWLDQHILTDFNSLHEKSSVKNRNYVGLQCGILFTLSIRAMTSRSVSLQSRLDPERNTFVAECQPTCVLERHISGLLPFVHRSEAVPVSVKKESHICWIEYFVRNIVIFFTHFGI